MEAAAEVIVDTAGADRVQRLDHHLAGPRIAVHPARRRTGLASALLGDLLVHAGAADRMLLEVSERNESAVAFYVAHGFTRIDVRPRYYRDGSDALVLHRTLVPAADASGRMAP